MRLFVAVNFSDEARKKIGSLIRELRELPSDVKWVDDANLHLTIQFLGNVPEDQVPDIVNVLKHSVAGIYHFKLDLGGVGAFPSTQRPRTFWMGVSGDTAVLFRLQRQIQEGLSKIGFKPEKRRFSPHLTLGRVRSAIGFTDVLKKAETLAREKVSTEKIGSIDLMLSELSPKGPNYFILSKIQLPGLKSEVRIQ
ncbi:RNA 2',3'-cyclic phosphodiesterase [Pelotomaculum isophthalicicum JI]|uniref:RNA 2',3'-cyclic phosphodiesterase n=1 Tax=Pelotomaculum isophthalicicum JI TaxID=947010 RepID=A0A9X4GZX3_9FIRM|nr:RNA 2',3'-cyclic phosphodiesterase [Pelotomaculum isophthalicicum]MDF9409260.1 RNA 2',3'-cyclic phosphodiesterase [Pelotomaculum isophthalicicum JI]